MDVVFAHFLRHGVGGADVYSGSEILDYSRNN
jgi:hypothetical protein